VAAIKDRHALEWVIVKEFCEARMADLREQNDGDLEPGETNRIRGMIAFAKEVLALEDTSNQVEVTNNTYID